MSIVRIPAESTIPEAVSDGPWSGSRLAEVFPADGDTRMSCGIHEIPASQTIVEKAPVDDVLHILEGEIRIDSDGTVETFSAGDFAYLHAGARQVYTVPDRVKLVYVTYPRNWT
jgi:ethanolamine utilization protein EutQ